MLFLSPTEFPNLDGRVAIITGGNRGIGLETVKGLCKANVTVIIGMYCKNCNAELVGPLFYPLANSECSLCFLKTLSEKLVDVVVKFVVIVNVNIWWLSRAWAEKRLWTLDLQEGFWIFDEFDFKCLPGRAMVASICHLRFKTIRRRKKLGMSWQCHTHPNRMVYQNEWVNFGWVGTLDDRRSLCVHQKQGYAHIIAIHVGDLIILAENILKMQKLKDSLRLNFKIHYYVCIVHNKEGKQVYLHQGRYTEKMLKKFGQTEVSWRPYLQIWTSSCQGKMVLADQSITSGNNPSCEA